MLEHLWKFCLKVWNRARQVQVLSWCVFSYDEQKPAEQVCPFLRERNCQQDNVAHHKHSLRQDDFKKELCCGWTPCRCSRKNKRGAAVRLGNQQVVHEGIWLSLSISAAPLFTLSERRVLVPVSLNAPLPKKALGLVSSHRPGICIFLQSGDCSCSSLNGHLRLQKWVNPNKSPRQKAWNKNPKSPQNNCIQLYLYWFIVCRISFGWR